MNIPDKWTFRSDEVAKGFDDHVREQLPWYNLVTSAVSHLGRHYIQEGGLIYDIGASTGNIGRALADVIDERSASLVAIESSKEMCDIYEAPGQMFNVNALDYEYPDMIDFAVCFLVCMFLPISQRKDFLSMLFDKVAPGGALIVVDKINTPAGYCGTALRRLPMRWKKDQGQPLDKIVEKELSLSGYQRPINEGILPQSAVKFFQLGEFCGWVIEKSEAE